MRRWTRVVVAFAAGAALAGCADAGRVASSTLEGMNPRGGGGLPAGMSSAPVTYTNKARNFQFTIPAGWAKTDGDPAGETATFRKGQTTAHFNFHYTQLSADFPAETSVKASLKSAQEEVRQGKNIAAKRRDGMCVANPKKLCARGWELIDNGKSGPQRIIWQAYDGGNFYFNFMASAELAEFPAQRAELQGIIDSVKFGM
jgi:hypothetical protein